MLSPSLYRNSRAYDFFIRSLGFQSSIDRFLTGLEVEVPADCRILDAGCGTGLVGLHFLRRIPNSTLLSTDLEPNFLNATLDNARRQGLSLDRMQVGTADISSPHMVGSLDGHLQELEAGSFHLVCIGAVVGYSNDVEESLRELIRLIAPGGFLVNLEMNEQMGGRYVSHRYQYDNIRLDRMKEVIGAEGCEVSEREFGWSHIPAKLTRTAILGRKTV